MRIMQILFASRGPGEEKGSWSVSAVFISAALEEEIFLLDGDSVFEKAVVSFFCLMR